MGKRSWKSKSSSRSSSGSTCIARRQAARYVPLKVPMHGQHVPAAQHSALVRHNTVYMGLSSGSSPWSSALTCDGKEGAGIHMIPVFFLYRFLVINSQLLGHFACFPCGVVCIACFLQLSCMFSVLINVVFRIHYSEKYLRILKQLYITTMLKPCCPLYFTVGQSPSPKICPRTLILVTFTTPT